MKYEFHLVSDSFALDIRIEICVRIHSDRKHGLKSFFGLILDSFRLKLFFKTDWKGLKVVGNESDSFGLNLLFERIGRD